MTDRRCGDCQLCCKLLPVRAIDKRGGEKCKFQKFHIGCTVYRRLEEVAPECRLWNCRWLVNDDADDLQRPDRSHYVIDIMPDIVRVRDNETGKETMISALQVWVDPAHRDAHKDPALRAYIQRRAERENMLALIRYSPSEGFALMPPALCADGQWHEDHTPPNPDVPSLADMLAAAAGARPRDEKLPDRWRS